MAAGPQNWNQTPHPYPGVPAPYPLEIIQKSWFGLPFYHFRCDWDVVGTPSVPHYNFQTSSGDPVSSVGDTVSIWTNTYGGGLGDASATPLATNTNIWTAQGEAYPRLVEILIEGKPFKALGFTGHESFAIDGSQITQKYDLSDGPLYSTCGTIYHNEEYGYGGASFLFVVSANETMRNGYNTASPFSNLLYGRHPQTNTPPYGDNNLSAFCTNSPWSPWCPPGSVTTSDIPGCNNWGCHVWPPVEEDGIEFWYTHGLTDNVTWDTATWGYGGGSQVMMKFGPQGWHHPRGAQVSYPSQFIPTREENKFEGIGKSGGSDGGFLNPPGFKTWQWPDCQSTPKTGLQAILLEFDGHSAAQITGPSHSDQPPWPELEGGYVGPTVNVYAISKDWLPPAWNDPPQGCPGFGSGESKYTIPTYTNKNICVSPAARTCPDMPVNYYEIMKIPHNYPALKNQTLWHDKFLFMCGLPQVALTSNPQGTQTVEEHGFKGYLFELLMFEGVLTDIDKIKLFKILKAKYNKGLG